ncbi:hypothetical protein [Cytobacillus luteolus]|uniref:hypothetical protein n=1 Tax=Litchfieldia luteola TaxID=682179 RepID=UPI001AE4AB8A|nr:hypothetical protein [Cytobacillus luteolus]MBP1944648.1 Arc/MetJ-type ribon-helix-helix transcriptional regulator [Cytobacillus luteolus]
MSQQVSVRLDDVHAAFLERMVEKLAAEGVTTNKSDVIQKAIYSFARETVLGAEEVTEIIDKHYKGF